MVKSFKSLDFSYSKSQVTVSQSLKEISGQALCTKTTLKFNSFAKAKSEAL